MKIKYLGTAAAEGIPGLFCQCPVCMTARKRGGRDIRSRTQAMIDETLMIDWPADSFYHMMNNVIHPELIKTLLFTHIHEDHYYPQDLGTRRQGFAHIDGCDPLTIVGSSDILTAPLTQVLSLMPCEGTYHIEVKIVEQNGDPYVTVDGYTVWPIKAVHGTDHPLCYVIEKDGKALMYAHDTSEFLPETWEYLKKNIKHLDFVSLDCTEGRVPMSYKGHMNFERDFAFGEKLKELGIATEETIFCCNHFSHNGKVTYDEGVRIAGERNYLVSYDGMEVEF
ncbi:MAG: hypothetical protein K6F14_04915 [Clostridiales bacterium]|nr:hypothetical protein [Clostridiales bacterium]